MWWHSKISNPDLQDHCTIPLRCQKRRSVSFIYEGLLWQSLRLLGVLYFIYYYLYYILLMMLSRSVRKILFKHIAKCGYSTKSVYIYSHEFYWLRCFSWWHWIFVTPPVFSIKAVLYSKTSASRRLYQHAINYTCFISELYCISRLWFLSLAHDHLLREIKQKRHREFYPYSCELAKL